jgi:hypothetical protein
MVLRVEVIHLIRNIPMDVAQHWETTCAATVFNAIPVIDRISRILNDCSFCFAHEQTVAKP